MIFCRSSLAGRITPAKAVFQLFKDMQGTGARRGILVAKGLSDDGWAAIEHLKSFRKMGFKRVRIHFHNYEFDGIGKTGFVPDYGPKD